LRKSELAYFATDGFNSISLLLNGVRETCLAPVIYWAFTAISGQHISELLGIRLLHMQSMIKTDQVYSFFKDIVYNLKIKRKLVAVS